MLILSVIYSHVVMCDSLVSCCYVWFTSMLLINVSN